MNEHSISYMQKCMAHGFNDYENLVICRDLLAQISKRPMPQGMDYDPKSDSYEEDVRRECGRIDFHLQELQLSLYPNEEAAPLLYPDNECASTDAFVSSYDSLNNHLKRDLNNTENTLCADDIKTLLLQNEFFARGGYKYFSTEIDDLAVWFASYGADTLSDCYKYGVGVPQSFHQAALWEQYAINLYYIYRDYYNKSDDESYRDSRLDEIGRLSVSCHIQRNLPDALYTDEQWGCISDFGCMPTELVALSRAEKPDTPYISHTSSLVMQMIQKTSLEELKQMGHTYLNYVRRNSSKNPLEDWKQAVNYYYAGAAQGDAECAAAVGYCCEMDPRGSNLPLALAWYQHAAKAGAAGADALGQGALGQQVHFQGALGVLLADFGSHADVGGDDALDLMIVDQLRNTEKLLALGTGGAAHVVGDQGQVLGTAGYQLLNDGTGLAAGQKAAAHNGGAIGDHSRCLFGSDNRFLCHFSSSLLFVVLPKNRIPSIFSPVIITLLCGKYKR